MKSFDPIDILFICLISCYLITFIAIVIMVSLKYRDYRKNKVEDDFDKLEQFEKVLATPIMKSKKNVEVKVVKKTTTSAKKNPTTKSKTTSTNARKNTTTKKTNTTTNKTTPKKNSSTSTTKKSTSTKKSATVKKSTPKKPTSKNKKSAQK